MKINLNKNTQKIVLERSLLSFIVLLIIRIGIFIPVPGLACEPITNYFLTHRAGRTIIGILAGDDSFSLGLFTLNIYPYINATLIVQFLIPFLPQLKKQQQEGSFEGQRSINRFMRTITLAWASIQSCALVFFLHIAVLEMSPDLILETVVWLISGSMIVLWLCEFISSFGLGSGSSVLIYVNIVANLQNLFDKLLIENNGHVPLYTASIMFIVTSVSLYALMFLQRGRRIIPLISMKELIKPLIVGAPKNYIPLRLNQAGVLPIILTSTVLIIPGIFINVFSKFGLIPEFTFLMKYEPIKPIIFWALYFLLIWLFSSLYAKIILNPKDMSDVLSKAQVIIPEVRPGVETTFYLKRVMQRVTLLGATVLAVLTTAPNLIETILNTTSLQGISLSSLLVLTGVLVDISREVKNVYYSNIYTDMYQ